MCDLEKERVLKRRSNGCSKRPPPVKIIHYCDTDYGQSWCQNDPQPNGIPVQLNAKSDSLHCPDQSKQLTCDKNPQEPAQCVCSGLPNNLG
ncbi:hypothetical protein BgiBS90_008329 [Biomphalaria glabrata]|nr:hypothetical protein BgiBS90_008329 [Biomphalaria glabrata]